MPQSRGVKRYPISGVLILNKPLGLSSNGALQRVKYLLRAKKAGHTGALDPLATGVLPLCFGEATKFSQYLLDSDKTYESDFLLGVATTSGDRDGDIVQEADASGLDREQVESCLAGFTGRISQVPPMHSALKHQGQPLYKLARQGIVIERKARDVEITGLTVLDFKPGQVARLTVSVSCSKGTYIRTLAEDVGAALGVGGHVGRLHRTVAGPFQSDQMLDIEDIERQVELIQPYDAARLESLLLPVDAGILHIPSLDVDAAGAAELRLGRKISLAQVRKGPVRVMLRGAFLGIAMADGNSLQPKRLLVDAP